MRNNLIVNLLLTLSGVGVCQIALGECVSYIKGPVIYDISSCRAVAVPQDLNLEDENFRVIKGLDPRNKAKLFNSYKGVVLDGVVVRSSAVQTGLDFKGALKGQEVKIFVAPGASSCAALTGKRIAAEVTEACCDGAAEAPCMLGTPYYFESVKTVGKAGSSAGDRKRRQLEKSEDFRAAAKLFKKRRYKQAAKALESLRSNGSLDVRGHYLLAVSYHKQELCKDAIAPLEDIYEKAGADKVWADQQKIVRSATFLLARCYARVNNPGKAVIILNSYLIEPKKYQDEIDKSLKAYEFGFIHTSKEYKAYKARANQYARSTDDERY